MEENSSIDFQNTENLNHLLELIGQINSNLEINHVLRNIIEAAKKITDSEASSVFLLDKETDELILTIPTGPVSDKIHGRRFPKNQGIAGWVATHSEAQIVNNVAEDERFYGDFEPEVFTTRSIFCVPLKNQKDEVIGVLQAINKRNTEYNEEELPLFQALAHQAAIAITNTRLLDERKTLLSEIHHRVKNNMAIISGLIQLQAFNEDDETLQNKKLDYTKNLKKVVEDTIEALDSTHDISVNYDCGPVVLNINQSIPCSLIVSEIIFHLVKYGFEHTENPEINIQLSEEDDHEVRIMIRENTESIKNYLDGEENDQSGFRLIQLLSQQLEATFDYSEGGDENRFTLQFKKSDRGGAGSHFL